MKNIEAIRKEKRIKQEVIAAELGIKQSSYSSYITREKNTVETVHAPSLLFLSNDGN